MKLARPVLATALAATLLLAACGSDDDSSTSSSSSSSSSGLSGTITVLAAASLQGTFTDIGKKFEADHPGTTIKLQFGASSALATQITNGSPADVFASASAKNMDAVVAAGDASDPKTFAKNVMEIAVPKDNPAKVTALADLAKSDVKVALCQTQVPCGATAQKVFTNAKITVKPVTEEADVKATLTKVRLGEVDAGVVYKTDVQAAAADVTGIEIPEDVNASTSYPIATVKQTTNEALAKAFIDEVLSADGTATLTAAGFAAP